MSIYGLELGGMVTVETPRVKISLDENKENLYILKNVIR